MSGVILRPDWLFQPELQQLMALLSGAGHQALVVGGAVRNAVMGLPPGDIDLSTDARPERMQALAGEAGLRHVPTGIEHGTITLIVNGFSFEVTCFRRDVATDGRRAVVSYSDDVAEDALRRDFTMNALYLRADGTLVDPLGGLADAQAGLVRFIQDPVQRIREDYLRILRFFRFNAFYGSDIDPEALAACAELAEGLEQLSRERVGAEMLKLLSAPDPAPAMAAFAATGGLGKVLPGADCSALAVLVVLEDQLAPDPLRRLALLGADDPAGALRLSKADGKRLGLIRAAALDGGDTAALAWRHGAAVARDAALVRAALIGAPPPPELEAQIALGAGAVFPVQARDLMDGAGAGLEGAALGEALTRMREDWIASGFTAPAAALLERDRLRRGDKPGGLT